MTQRCVLKKENIAFDDTEPEKTERIRKKFRDQAYKENWKNLKGLEYKIEEEGNEIFFVAYLD